MSSLVTPGFDTAAAATKSSSNDNINLHHATHAVYTFIGLSPIASARRLWVGACFFFTLDVFFFKTILLLAKTKQTRTINTNDTYSSS